MRVRFVWADSCFFPKTLPVDLCSLGYQNQLCIDFSEIVISQMRQRYESIPIEWRVMDVREMDLPNDHVDLAIDKV